MKSGLHLANQRPGNTPAEHSKVLPVRESLVLLPNMSSVAFMGAVSLASMVSTFPVEQKTRTD